MLELNRRSLRWAVAALACGAVYAQASLVAYTSPSAFFKAVGALPGVGANTEGFEGSAGGTRIADGSALHGLTYHYGSRLAGSRVSIAVGTGSGTTSPANYLGIDDGGVFQSGDDFSLAFTLPARAVGMYFVSRGALFDGGITLSVDGLIASLLVADERNFGLTDGRVYFLGLVDDAGSFSIANIGSCSLCSFRFNIDDIVTVRNNVNGVPAPGTLALAILGLTACGALSRRRGARAWPAMRVSTART